jgi:hypothetical protein
MQTVVELTEEQIAFRKACAYLKGYVVGLSVRKGMKWKSTKESSESFQEGFDSAQKPIWVSDEYVTLIHILYNRFRHDRPHRQTVELDDEYIQNKLGMHQLAAMKEAFDFISEDELRKFLEVRHAE